METQLFLGVAVSASYYTRTVFYAIGCNSGCSLIKYSDGTGGHVSFNITIGMPPLLFFGKDVVGSLTGIMTISDYTQIKRIAIVGPECTGKTQLSIALADYYKTVWVPEYARQYLDRLDRTYEQRDLLEIARWQLLTEDELALEANGVLVCDTNLVVIKIWSEFKFGGCDPEIIRLLNTRKYDLHLLTNIDVPWENDPQREHPDKRDYFYNLYKNELEKLGVDFVEISGNENKRLLSATQAVNNVISLH